MATSDDSTAPLQELCVATRRACEVVTPMVAAVYRSIQGDQAAQVQSTKKQDNSAFTIADGLVQHLLVHHFLLPSSFDKELVVGEEDCEVDLERWTVNGDLIIPAEIRPLVQQAQVELQSLTMTKAWTMMDGNNCNPADLVVFIDPIDGTREFTSGTQGEQCTICVGFVNRRTGKPVAGVVYRPLSQPLPTWAIGAKSEDFFDCSLQQEATSGTAEESSSIQLVTSNGSISPFLESLLQQDEYHRFRNGGAGNKVLLLLEKKNAVYIQDRGLSRWDTCAAQAIVEAQGGILCQLTSFLSSSTPEETSYTYLPTEENLDFPGPGIVVLTKYNALRWAADAKKSMVQEAKQLKPYANVCGILALPRHLNTVENKKQIWETLCAVCQENSPSFN